MKRRAFDELNSRSRVAAAVHFRQSRLRRENGLTPGFGLCAALVEIWWEGARNGGDVLPSLQLPRPEFMQEIISRQCQSAYLQHLPAEEPDVKPADRALLELKYGTSNLQEVVALNAKEGTPSPLEIDLQLRHRAMLVEKCSWTVCRLAPPVAGIAPAQPGLRLMLLRYAKSGHRMAFVVDAQGGVLFFDPNSGEVRFASGSNLADWLSDFWEVAGYSRRAPTVWLYRFTPYALAETSTRGN